LWIDSCFRKCTWQFSPGIHVRLGIRLRRICQGMSRKPTVPPPVAAIRSVSQQLLRVAEPLVLSNKSLSATIVSEARSVSRFLPPVPKMRGETVLVCNNWNPRAEGCVHALWGDFGQKWFSGFTGFSKKTSGMTLALLQLRQDKTDITNSCHTPESKVVPSTQNRGP